MEPNNRNGHGREVPELDKVLERYQEILLEKTELTAKSYRVGGCCQEWKGPISKQGYGIFRVYMYNKRYGFQVHRLFWAMDRGRYPSPNSDIHHKCENTKCVNPAHLVACGWSKNRGKRYTPATDEELD